MTEIFDLVVRGGTVVTPGGLAVADIGVNDGRIVRFAASNTLQAGEVFDAQGLHVLPGVIDTQVHFREPGGEHKEDLASGAAAAAMGGVVGVFEMPNTNPSTDSVEALQDKLSRASGRMWVDHAFYVGATDRNLDQLNVLELEKGCSGVKIFMGSSTGGLLLEDDANLIKALKNGHRRVAVHAEDEPRLRERKKLAEEAAHPRAHPLWRDVDTALTATRRLISAARQTGRKVHVLHVTTAEEMQFLATQKDLATVETTPNHLTLFAPDCYERLGTRAQMNPPVREAHHQAAIWQAINDGVVDILGSDHAPHTLQEKAGTYPATPSGMPGVQTLVPVMLTHVNAGKLSLGRFVDLVCAGPQRAFGLVGKGRIALGYDADFTIVDMQADWEISDDWIMSKCSWTPYHGFKASARPIATIIRGQQVMRDNQLLGQPGGKPIRFQDTLGTMEH
ncbi:MAG: dihydroorotase [Rhodospirillales bacterium]